jgi:hypothetical protein
MKRTARLAVPMAAFTTAAVLGWVLLVGLPRWHGGPSNHAGAPPPVEPAPPGRKIKAHLFYLTEDGMKLTSVERDVAYGEGTVEQAKSIITAQIAPVAEPLVSAVPPGTALRALFVTPQGEAYLDLTGEVVRAHPGGSLNELLTVYTLVDALAANLPAISAVQLLVDGKEVDTLAGHIDLRRPLLKNLALVE